MESKRTNWGATESQVTDERLFNQRRKFLQLGAATLVSSAAMLDLLAAVDPNAELHYTASKNPDDLKLTDYDRIAHYNNYYEFTTSKEGVDTLSKDLKTSPWDITIDGLAEKPLTLSMEEIYKFPLEERIYRFRCVEGWSMVVPWIGFPLSYLINKAKPLSSAKYVRFETLYDPKQFPDQNRGLFAAIDYPYVEGLRMDEAENELTLLAVGLYGKKLPPQNGAPIRLVVPWKYGFKSIKSIAQISFTDKEPLNTWQKANPKEYGFYANVNPEVDHPRWSQARERVLGSFFKQKTLMFNGYSKEVAYLYKGMDLRKNF